MSLRIPASLRWFISFKFAVAAAAFALWLTGMFTAKWIVLALVRRTYRHRWERLDTVVAALSPALRLIICIVGVQFALSFVSIPVRWQKFVDFGVIGAVVLAFIVAADGLLRVWMRVEAEHLPILGEDYGIVTGALRGVLVGLGLMMFLASIGISISPILASLGIGSLALALALQETIKNIFSGFFIIADQPMGVGDYVKLSSGEQGWLTKIGWRSSRFQMFNDSVVVVPNSALVDTTVTNYRAKDGAIALEIDLNVAGGSDVSQVSKITEEIAGEVMTQVEGGVPDYKPTIHLQTVSGTAIGLMIVLRVSVGTAIETVRDEFIRRVCNAYQREGIYMAP